MRNQETEMAGGQGRRFSPSAEDARARRSRATCDASPRACLRRWPGRSAGGLGYCAGFLMLEVAVALSVLAVGLVALFSLLGTGLDSGLRAGAETRAAVFARGALAGLRAESDRSAESGEWERFWSDFSEGSLTIPVPAGDAWADDAALALRAGALTTNRYLNISYRSDEATDIEDHVLRYRLDVELSGPEPEWTNRAAVVLRVWEGEFGSTSGTRAVEFYTEYGKHDL